MGLHDFPIRIHISITPKVYRKLKQKKKDGYSINGYVRSAIDKALRENDSAIEEAG